MRNTHYTTCKTGMARVRKYNTPLPPDRNWQADLLTAIEVWFRWTVVGTLVFVAAINLGKAFT